MNLFSFEYLSGIEFLPFRESRLRARLFEDFFIELNGDDLPFDPLEINGDISGDPIEPRVKARCSPKVFELLVYLDEDLLGDIKGVLMVVGDTVSYPINLLLVPSNQLLKGVLVALTCLLNKLKVRDFSSPILLLAAR